MRRVIVNIDRLVLKGFRFEDRHAIAQGLQAQLTRLLADPGMAEQIAGLGNVPRLGTKAISISRDETSRQVGKVIADGIGKGLAR